MKKEKYFGKISCFHCDVVVEAFALLRCYAAQAGS
jgi:hypothetical protein